jgi:putative integration host factor IHF alpha subunit
MTEKKFQLQDLAEQLAREQGISSQEALEFVRTFFELTEVGILKDSLVKVSGFGTTKLVIVNERESVNIHTGERFQIGKHSKITFTPDNTLRDLVNSPFALLSTTTLYDDTPEEELDSVPIIEDDFSDDSEDTLTPEEVTNHSEQVQVAEALSSEAHNTSLHTDDSTEVAKGLQSDESSTADVVPQESLSEELPSEDNDNVSVEEKISTTEFSITTATDTILEDCSTQVDANAIEFTSSSTADDNLSSSTSSENTLLQSSTESTESRQEEETLISTTTQDEELGKETTADLTSNPANVDVTLTTISAETENKPSHITNIQGEIHVTTDNLNHKEQHHRTRFNVLLVAFVLLLVVLSYFAGYYHWLCPNCPQSHVVPPTQLANNAQHNPRVSDTVTTLPGKNSDSTAKTPPPTDTSSSTSDAQTNDATATSSPEKTKKEEKAAPQVTTTQTIIVKSQHLSSQQKEQLLAKSRQWQQLPHGKSIIVGTYASHVVQTGESIPRLAKRYYGSSNYANYIVLFNHIKDPDVIKVGQQIKMPQLLQQ